MHPVLSWAIFFVIVLGYFALNGLPRSIPRPFIQESDKIGGSSKRSKKQARNLPNKRDSKLYSNSSHESDSDSTQHVPALNTSSKPLKDNKSSQVGAMITEAQMKQVASRDPATNGVTAVSGHDAMDENAHDSDDPVENVMKGRPRKTSTPIGMRSNKLAISNGAQKSPIAALTSEDADEDDSRMSYVESRQVTRSHATDDMLPTNNTSLPRTLKIVPSTQTNGHNTSTTQKPKKGDDKLTKKQRQNAAKKLKAKAEKADADERQAAALRSHKKTREAQRLAEQVSRSSNAVPLHTNNVWDSQDWTTVSKNKKPTSVEALPEPSTEALIWDP